MDAAEKATSGYVINTKFVYQNSKNKFGSSQSSHITSIKDSISCEKRWEIEYVNMCN